MSKKKDRGRKIKIRCPSCNKKNIFSKENWKGKDNTCCKYCGTNLNAKKTYKPITNLSKSISKNKTHNSFYEATKPSLKYKTNSRKKPWILFSITMVFILSCAYLLDNQDRNTLEKVHNLNKSDLIPPKAMQELCMDIQGVPAWVQNEEVINYGYKPNWNVSYLINNKIYFYYSTTCSVCHKQIEEFGSGWGKYNLSGYVIKCW